MKIIEQINECLANPNMVSDRPRTAHYPSEASVVLSNGTIIGKCHRAAWYSWLGEKPTNPIDSRGLWSFEHGHMLEAVYIEQCKRKGIWAADHIKFFDKERNISGEVDIFIFNDHDMKKEKTIEGVEIKTAYGFGFKKQVKEGPKIENLLQVGLYIDRFKVPFHLVYQARDTHEQSEYTITMHDDGHLMIDGVPYKAFYMKDVYERYNKLGGYVMRGEEPARDYTYGFDLGQSEARCSKGLITRPRLAKIKAGTIMDSDWQCVYCSHIDRCWHDKRSAMKMKG